MALGVGYRRSSVAWLDMGALFHAATAVGALVPRPEGWTDAEEVSTHALTEDAVQAPVIGGCMTHLVFAILLLTGVAQSNGAHSMFRVGDWNNVAIQYWLQAEDGHRLTESQAQPGTRYSLHLRNNVAGFLTVFLTADGTELTTRNGNAGQLLPPDSEFVAPGTLRLTAEGSLEQVVFLFARSQTEQVATASQALAKLDRLRQRTGAYGPALVTETVGEGPDVGTYVVNRYGAQPASTIRLAR
jgi:hypothetical protein